MPERARFLCRTQHLESPLNGTRRLTFLDTLALDRHHLDFQDYQRNLWEGPGSCLFLRLLVSRTV